MPAKKARIYLFHGTDSRASSQAVSRWEQLFREKFGESTRYVINADELTANDFQKQVEQSLLAQSLLPMPTLTIIKRTTAQEKGKSTPHTQALLKVLDQAVKEIGEESTVAVWEDRQLSSEHPLYTWFSQAESAKTAKVNQSTIPNNREVVPTAQKYLSSLGTRLSQDGERWIFEKYQAIEKQQRLARRLRAHEALLEDDRSWWLFQILETAANLADREVTAEVLEQVSGIAAQPVGVFELVNSIGARRFTQARALLQEWEKEPVGDSEYFALYSLLRTQYRKDGNQRALQLLADVELISKNYPVPHAWLTEALLVALEKGEKGQAVISPRALWKAHLQRT